MGSWQRFGEVFFWIVIVLWLPVAVGLNVFWGWGREASVTLGAHAFLTTGTLFLPALAVAGHTGRSVAARFTKSALLVGVGIGGLALSAAMAVALFPDYPQRGPHELVAAATVLPGIAMPLAVLAFARRLNLRPKAWLYCSVWAAVLLGGTVAVFGRELDMALPLSTSVRRWESNDIQDYSNYFLRADGVDSERASKYAKAVGLERTVGELECRPAEAPEWAPPPRGQIWQRDDRKPQQDRERYPNGLAGCLTQAASTARSLYVCEICDWGI